MTRPSLPDVFLLFPQEAYYIRCLTFLRRAITLFCHFPGLINKGLKNKSIDLQQWM